MIFQPFVLCIKRGATTPLILVSTVLAKATDGRCLSDWIAQSYDRLIMLFALFCFSERILHSNNQWSGFNYLVNKLSSISDYNWQELQDVIEFTFSSRKYVELVTSLPTTMFDFIITNFNFFISKLRFFYNFCILIEDKVHT